MKEFLIFGRIMQAPAPTLGYDYSLAAQFLHAVGSFCSIQGLEIAPASPYDALVSHMIAALVLAAFMSTPIAIYEMWAFVSPALRENQKRTLMRYIVGFVVLFSADFLFACLISASYLISFLYVKPSIYQLTTLLVGAGFLMGTIFASPLVVLGLGHLASWFDMPPELRQKRLAGLVTLLMGLTVALSIGLINIFGMLLLPFLVYLLAKGGRSTYALYREIRMYSTHMLRWMREEERV
jgi:Sec-independent protein secretion pathway component TatC